MLADIFQWKVICQHKVSSLIKSLHKKYFPIENACVKKIRKVPNHYSFAVLRPFVFIKY
nr:MAG TPA: hypothetical protein [Caudoviricetes sp.]